MKFFVYITLIAAIFSAVLAGPVSSGSSASADKEAAAEQNAHQNMFDLSRFRKSAYGGGASSIPAPLCPRNYLISCQPNLAPVACAPAPGGY